MSGQKEEVYVPHHPVIEFTSKSRVASWPITSLRSLISALNHMGCSVQGKNKQLEQLGMADLRFSNAISQLKENSLHGNLDQTKNTIDIIQEVENAANELRSAQEQADASRPKTIHTISPSGRGYNLRLKGGSYIVQYREKEKRVDGKLDSVVKDLAARKFVNDLTHSYCEADEEHKKILSEEEMGLDKISVDLREQLRNATKVMGQWQKVQEVSRIRNLIRERKEFYLNESKMFGHETEVFEFGDHIVIKIEDSGGKKSEGKDDQSDSRQRSGGR